MPQLLLHASSAPSGVPQWLPKLQALAITMLHDSLGGSSASTAPAPPASATAPPPGDGCMDSFVRLVLMSLGAVYLLSQKLKVWGTTPS